MSRINEASAALLRTIHQIVKNTLLRGRQNTICAIMGQVLIKDKMYDEKRRHPPRIFCVLDPSACRTPMNNSSPSHMVSWGGSPVSHESEADFEACNTLLARIPSLVPKLDYFLRG